MTLQYWNQGSEPLEKLRLRLDPNLSPNGSIAIRHVRTNESDDLTWRFLPFRFGRLHSEQGLIEIELPSPLAPHGKTEIQIGFEFSDKRMVNGNAIMLQDDPYHSLDAWYPKAMTKLGDDWSINDDRPSTYHVTIELPADLAEVASTGKFVSKKYGETGSALVRMTADDVRGFTIYSSRPWKKHHRDVAGVEVKVHLPPDAEHWADPILTTAADAIEYYRQEFGDYPADHLEITCPGSLTGQAHGSSATCNGVTLFLHSDFEAQYRSAIAHEIAHQYFGSSIGIDRREIAWAPIGLGLLMDRDYLADRGLNDERLRKTIQWFYFEALRRGFDTNLSQPVDKLLKEPPPWSTGWNMSLMHGKAYEVCKMLESLVGKERFKNVLRKMINERKGGLLTGPDLIDYCEEVYGQPLDWFVADWIDGNAKLDYAVTEVKSVKEHWEVEITQVGDAAFPATVEAETETGIRLRQTIDRSKRVNRITFATSDAMKRVILDPDVVCPDVNLSNNTWSNPVSRGENTQLQTQ
jgi:hypothetical protein